MNTGSKTEMPLTISFRHMEPSPWLEDVIVKRSERLSKFYSRIVSCRVVVEMPHRHHHQGNFLHIRLEITVPGRKIMISHQPSEHAQAEDINAVIKDVFERAKRQLEDYARVQRGDVKAHALVTAAPLEQEIEEEEPEEVPAAG